MSWEGIARRAAQARSARLLDRIEAAVAEQEQNVDIERASDSISLRGRGMKARRISDAGLRFARMIEQ